MNVFPRDDKRAIFVNDMTVESDGSILLETAHQLYDGLFQALQECGVRITLQVEVPPPTDTQIATAVHRVGHLRRTLDKKKGWDDVRTNMDIVYRVLEACR